MTTIRRKINFSRRPDKTVALAVVTGSASPLRTRVPRIAKLMALAIHLKQELRNGRVRDQTELARLLHITQPRLTQIMNLNHLAPSIQEALLFLPAVECGRERVHERVLRPIAAEMSWARQRELWNRLQAASARQGN